MTSDKFGGAAPKFLAKIHKALKCVMNANEPLATGPSASGLGKDDWVVVQSFKTRSVWYLAVLKKNRIDFRSRQEPAETSILVRYPDLSAARMLYEKHA